MMCSALDGSYGFSIGSIRSDERCFHADSNEADHDGENDIQAATHQLAVAANDGQEWSGPEG